MSKKFKRQDIFNVNELSEKKIYSFDETISYKNMSRNGVNINLQSKKYEENGYRRFKQNKVKLENVVVRKYKPISTALKVMYIF